MELMAAKMREEGTLRLYRMEGHAFVITYEPCDADGIRNAEDYEVQIYYNTNERQSGMEFFNLCTKKI